MDQFKSSWLFALNNWKYFTALALPLIVVESLMGYLIIPLGEMTQTEDFLNFIQSNSAVIAVVGIVALILQISFLGGLWISYLSIDKGEIINPFNALQGGLYRFFPIFGAYIIVTIASAFGYLLLIIPGIYLSARFSLFVPQIIFEENKVLESIGTSWEKTDEHGSKLFMFTLVFFILIFLTVITLQSIIPTGILQTIILAIVEYIFIIPLGYIYFTLYKSLKTN